jgi:Asp-tRNA(Asn)/Glu-tRNA(Gln) amidotransferase A subunit family amidase
LVWVDDVDELDPVAVVPAVSNPHALARALNNTAIADFFDLCDILLPGVLPAALPVGFTPVARIGQDQRLLAAATEQLFAA